MPFSTVFPSYHGNQFTYECVSWFSNTSTPHNILSKQLAAFPHRLLNNPLTTVTFVKRGKECWSSWDSNSQSLDWQPDRYWLSSGARLQMSFNPSAVEDFRKHWGKRQKFIIPWSNKSPIYNNNRMDNHIMRYIDHWENKKCLRAEENHLLTLNCNLLTSLPYCPV